MGFLKNAIWLLLVLYSLSISTPANAHENHYEDSQYFVYHANSIWNLNEHQDDAYDGEYHGETLDEICEKIRVWHDNFRGTATVIDSGAGPVQDANGTVTKLSYYCEIEYDENYFGEFTYTTVTGFAHCDILDSNGETSGVQRVCELNEPAVCEPEVGNPVNLTSALKVESQSDWTSPLDGRFQIVRDYTSRLQIKDNTSIGHGLNWSTIYQSNVCAVSAPLI